MIPIPTTIGLIPRLVSSSLRKSFLPTWNQFKTPSTTLSIKRYWYQMSFGLNTHRHWKISWQPTTAFYRKFRLVWPTIYSPWTYLSMDWLRNSCELVWRLVCEKHSVSAQWGSFVRQRESWYPLDSDPWSTRLLVWINEIFAYVKGRPDDIRNGFEKLGITDACRTDFTVDDNPFADLLSV